MSGPPAPPRQLAPIAAAVLLPLAVVVGVLGVLSTPRPRPLSPEVAELDRRLSLAKDLSVVIVGNSKARTDIDPSVITAKLGRPASQIATLDVAASTAPVWYAALENRVWAHGYTPDLIVVYGPLGMALDTQVHSTFQRQRLEENMGDVEPVLGPKSLGRSGGASWLERAQERRSEVHEAWTDAVKGLAVSLLPGAQDKGPPPPDATLVSRGLARAKPALKQVFGEGAELTETNRARVIPIAEADGPLIASEGGTARESLLADFVDLADAHNARIVFVRAPLAPSDRASDAQPGAVVRDVVALLNERKAGWIDLSAISLPDAAFRDSLHMNEKGRVVLSRRLGEELVRIGAKEPGPLAPAQAPFQPESVERVGTAPTLPPLAPKRTNDACGWSSPLQGFEALGDSALATLGLGAVSPVLVLEDGRPLTAHAGRADFADRCAGAFVNFGREVRYSPSDVPDSTHTYTLALSPDLTVRSPFGDEAWWVYPGTTLRFTFTQPWSGEGTPQVNALVRAVTPGALTLTAGDQRVDLAGESLVRAGRVTPSATSGTWTVEIASPADGAWAVVEGLAIGEGESLVWLVGQPPAPVRIYEGKPIYAGPPPALAVAGEPVPDRGNLRKLSVPGTAILDDPTTFKRLGVRDCSPLRPAADGVTLTAPHLALPDIDQKGGGRYAHQGDWLYFGAVNPLAPPAAGHAWTAFLDPNRLCEAGWWLYPGDHVTVATPMEGLRRLRFGATRLEILGAAFGDAALEAAGVRVRLRAKDEVRVDTELTAAQWNAGPIVLRLDPPLPPRVAPVLLELESTAQSPYVIVSNATLAEDVSFGAAP